jgi:predicted membrane-bound spermidine synthase
MLRKFPHLSFVLLIEGGALMAVELMGAKLVAPFYGNSLYVWTAVLMVTVLGLTLGYYAGGRFAKRRPSETKLFVILGISAVLVLGLPVTASISIAFTKGMDLILGICITCILLLLPPMLCFGTVGPMVVRLMSSRLETIGKTAGTVYFTSTLGGIAATFFVGLYLIPVAGLRLCATLTGLALAALPVIYILKRVCGIKQWPGSTLPATAVILPNAKALKLLGKKSSARKRSELAITAMGLSIYLFAFLEGGTVMAVELLSVRMVAPYFGSSLYVWGTVLGSTLLALAIGYFAGGVVADKNSGPDTLLWLLLIASAFLMLMHISATLLTVIFENVSPALAVILVSLCLILPPLIFLGMVPTFLIRRGSITLDGVGQSTGVVYASSSASGIVVLPVFGFFIIPRFGLTLPSIVTGLIVGSIPLVRLIVRKRYGSLLLIPIALLSVWAIKTQRPSDTVDVKYFSEGLLGQVLVADVSGDAGQKSGERMVMMNRSVQMAVDRTTFMPRWDYIYCAYSICSKLPEKSDALALGLGGGVLANIFQNRLRFTVDAVELDQRMAQVARQYFGLSGNVKVIVDDARHYLEVTQKKYDLILFDVFRGEFPPPHVFTIESLAKAKSLLKEDGLIVVNFYGFLQGKIGTPTRSIYKTLQAAGLEPRILPTSGAEAHRNLLFVASKKKQDFSTVRYPLLLSGQQINIETLFLDPRNVDLSDAVVLTDDKPILELLNVAAGNAWRDSFVKTTEKFYQQGVPLFR